MEIDHKPSVWPFVAMLVALLLFCMTVPLFWRSDGGVESSRSEGETTEQIAHRARGFGINGAANLPYGARSFGDGRWGLQNTKRPDDDLLALWGPPTIEELIAARLGSVHRGEVKLEWPVLLRPAAPPPVMVRTVIESPVSQLVTVHDVQVLFESAGSLLARYSPRSSLPQLFGRGLVEAVGRTAAEAAAPSVSAAASSLRVVDPRGRKAIAPVLPRDDGVVTNPAPPRDPWCVPQALFDQLERLACHPYSSDWAEHTISQLRTLTERERLGGPDAQVILMRLSAAAQNAVPLAEESSDERLRVELLRAHWALARRLDAWGVMHEIRVADRSRERLASRGAVGSLFDSGPIATGEEAGAPALTRDLEEYEQTRDPQLGRQLAREQRALESSPDSLDRALAEAVEQHYRNANLRLAITAEVLNRFVESERSEVRPVRDRIAGTPVRGRSHTQSESRVRLDPATGRWQMSIEADGVVQSDTLADGGRARLRSQSATDFSASKSIIVHSNGVRLEQTVVGAATRNRLVGVTTDFDWVPLFGSYARDRAVQEYRARRARAAAEVEYRVSSQAADQIDQETQDSVARIERQVRERVTDRLAESGVELAPIELTTTHQRIVGRFRVAGNHQLGSHTPRPRALSDSLASVQVHETAFTNAAVSLALDGRRFSGPELQAHFRQKFPRMANEDPGQARRDAVFHFAAEDAVRLHIEGGRLELSLSLAAVEQEGRLMRNFIVHAYYVPVVNGLEAELVRDGSLGIEGRLSSAERARLHNVFNSVLPAERAIPLVRLEDPNDERLAGLMITQLVLEDGWLGLAVGPAQNERVAERERSLR